MENGLSTSSDQSFVLYSEILTISLFFRTTPLGIPVVPEVYEIIASSFASISSRFSKPSKSDLRSSSKHKPLCP